MTKPMTNSASDTQREIKVKRLKLEIRTLFKYLGTVVSGDCSLKAYTLDRSSNYAKAVLDHMTNKDIRRNIWAVIRQHA